MRFNIYWICKGPCFPICTDSMNAAWKINVDCWNETMLKWIPDKKSLKIRKKVPCRCLKLLEFIGILYVIEQLILFLIAIGSYVIWRIKIRNLKKICLVFVLKNGYELMTYENCVRSQLVKLQKNKRNATWVMTDDVCFRLFKHPFLLHSLLRIDNKTDCDIVCLPYFIHYAGNSYKTSPILDAHKNQTPANLSYNWRTYYIVY